ncbi:MAG: DUF4364 family protein [Butyrivibrio sp.]|nr:DUF4364 family protein [Butyrivibrio sp.]
MASQYLTLYKMIVLYMLNRSDVTLSKSQIYDFILENEYTTFLTLQEVFGEMRDQKLVVEKISRNRTYLELTDEGKEALRFFITEINPAIIQQVDEFLKKNRIRLRNESSILADYLKRTSGEYEAHLMAKENGEAIIDLKLAVPTEEMAAFVCDRWQKESQTIYQYLVDRLLTDSTDQSQ